MSALQQSLREYLDTVPVIETHVHYTSNTEVYADAFPMILGYLKSDLRIAAGRRGAHVIEYLADASIPFRKRYQVFEPLYEQCRHTSYAKAMVRGLQVCWGIPDASYASLCLLNERLPERNQDFYRKTMERLHIRAQIADIFESRFFSIVDGSDTDYTSVSKFAFPLPAFHRLYTYEQLDFVQNLTGRTFVCLDDYVEAVEELLQKGADWGMVCIKDQSAYFRSLQYKNPTKAEAEKAFNTLVSQPLHMLGTEEGAALDDWLFHRFLRKAGKLDLPVQLHTGLQDRICMIQDRVGSDITAVNAARLIPVLTQHQDVQFDLFHASWPYLDEILSIGKNFPNAYIDLCWTHAIDPLYSIELMKRATMCMPSTRLLGFGGDAFVMENGVGYLEMAKDNIAQALAELVECGWLNRREAEALAVDWLYYNPKNLFRLDC